MSNLFLLGLICVIPIIAIVLAEKNRRDKLLRDNARVCLTSLTTLKALLIYIQRHRGLTTGSLHGDASLRGQIQQVASKIEYKKSLVKRPFLLWLSIFSVIRKVSNAFDVKS